jgi:hypothetical protein
MLAGLFCLALCTCFLVQQTVARPDLLLTDLWDSPRSLDDICDGQATIMFICDTELTVCREGAVFFDTMADGIEAEGLRAVLVFTGPAAEARAFALKTRILHSIFVDSDGKVFDSLLDQEVLPALVLVDKDGRHLRTLYGGGESLDGNIAMLLEDGATGGPRWWLILIPFAVAALLPFLLS